MNRIRHAYLQLAPELEPYFVTSKYDDEAEILRSSLAAQRPLTRMQPFISAPGVVAVIDSVVAGAIAGIAGVGLDLGVVGALAVGAMFFLLSMAFFAYWARDQIGRVPTGLDPMFPSPERPS